MVKRAVRKQNCLVRNVRVERRQDVDIGRRFGRNVCDGSIGAQCSRDEANPFVAPRLSIALSFPTVVLSCSVSSVLLLVAFDTNMPVKMKARTRACGCACQIRCWSCYIDAAGAARPIDVSTGVNCLRQSVLVLRGSAGVALQSNCPLALTLLQHCTNYDSVPNRRWFRGVLPV